MGNFLIEWDTDLPSLDVLLGEAAQAQTLLDERAGSGMVGERALDGAPAWAA